MDTEMDQSQGLKEGQGKEGRLQCLKCEGHWSKLSRDRLTDPPLLAGK